MIEVLNPAMFDGARAAETSRKKPHAPWYFLSVTIALGTVCAALLYLFIT
jgi:hypothetical protein